MDEKTRAIKYHLLKGMEGREIQYQHSGSLHKYRIEGKSPTHWLYVAEELVDDSSPEILINIINVYRIVDTLNNSDKQKWLFLSGNGIQQVDENFAKQTT